MLVKKNDNLKIMSKNFVIIHSCTKIQRIVQNENPFFMNSFNAMSKYDTNSHHVSIGNIKEAKWVGPRTDKFFYEMLDKS